MCGVSSWYGPGFHGKTTASGEMFDKNKMTAAHRTLEFGTKVRVTRVRTGDSVIVTINDRGPFVDDRIVDLSEKAAYRLGIKEQGIGKVCLQIVR